MDRHSRKSPSGTPDWICTCQNMENQVSYGSSDRSRCSLWPRLITTINMPQAMCDCWKYIETNDHPQEATYISSMYNWAMWDEDVLWRYATKALGSRGDHMAEVVSTHIYGLFYWWIGAENLLWIMFGSHMNHKLSSHGRVKFPKWCTITSLCIGKGSCLYVSVQIERSSEVF